LGHILARQWHVVVLSTIAALMLAVIYLMIARPTYTSVSTLVATPFDPASITSNNPSLMQADSDFQETQCVIIKSDAVIALAMDKIRDCRTLKGVAHPLDYVAAGIDAEPARVGRAIDVSFESHYPEDANLIVDSVVDAYRQYESQTWKNRADEFVSQLTKGNEKQEQELVHVQQRIHDMAMQYDFPLDGDPEKSPQHAEVMSLRDERQKDKLETLRAQSAYQQASRAIVGDPDLNNDVAEAEKHPTYSVDPEADLKKFQDELALEQAKLQDDSRSYLPNHPVMVTDRARVNAMIVSTVVAAKQWEEIAQAREEAVEKSLAAAEKSEQDIADAQRQYIQLRADSDRLRKASDEVNDRVHQLDVMGGEGAVYIAVLNPGKVLNKPKPDSVRTLMIGFVLGVIGGLALACVRDWTDDRMRTPQAVRSTIGAPVLGAIPAITTAYTAADRGQIVLHEPFGDAAESYRTLRTGLQFGLPPGTKTILVTSPVAGDGKSTFVSNLAIAMAQASKRVLIIDGDFRAPMQHRLFGLKDRFGLASVLAGEQSESDPFETALRGPTVRATVEQAIQRTEVSGLDVLPCGPIPSNPAELLNGSEFADHLNALADKYDIVLLDSPPVTAVADARILAALADVSVLVIRMESSTRKQAEGARDGLRSVGARLIGVAVNGVSRSGHFGGSSGYYQNQQPQTAASRPAKSLYTDTSASDPASRV
jgi:capsular exopolysaccharide synthesis family protein